MALALITGGSRGVGAALAAELAGRGYRLLLCGRDAAALHRVAAKYPQAVGLPCDLGDLSQVRMLAETASRLGNLALLVNNAAIQHVYQLGDLLPDQACRAIDEEIAVNLTGPLQLTAHCLPMLRAQPGARIVNITSGLALAPKRGAAVYCATKSGLRTFTRSLRYQEEAARSGVGVTEVVLPLVDTDMTTGRGTNKISSQDAARAIARAVDENRDEVHVGKIKLLHALHRISPQLSYRVLRDA
ncbi:SDR family NAD(P)-dependent oxidoreductase [Rhizohabitans arisaemae]|uniref:SDR family NAD(P)-dependent oxidoreductase n=1 Tax=Rhizohabitans arisaemae TaxID=2720610 RepID=UPI0024B20E03|nr:SDR family NAD(P)-dependent oxidoreductase [Rhizohabitans arisaemae]